jgi:transcriptional regulator with XRE-family HTH domain
MSDNVFGDFVKERRTQLRLSLRAFAEAAGMDPGNASRIERGLVPPPESPEVLGRIAGALQLEEGSEEFETLTDFAAAAKGRLPADLLSDSEVAARLPILFRTLRSKPLSKEQFERLIETIRKS